MMMNPRSLLGAFLLACSAACAALTEPDAAPSLQVSRRPAELVLTNATERPVYFAAFEEQTAAVTFWAPCDDPERCPHVAPGERKLIPYSAVSGYRPGAEVALVYWWHLVPKPGGGFRPDSTRVEAIRF